MATETIAELDPITEGLGRFLSIEHSETGSTLNGARHALNWHWIKLKASGSRVLDCAGVAERLSRWPRDL